MNCTSNVFESRLRHRIVLLEDSLARMSSTRKELRENVDAVKNEVRLVIGDQLYFLRKREQQLLEKLDIVANVKDGILCAQQNNLHKALGACTQGLHWLNAAYQDLIDQKLKSLASVELRIEDILNNQSAVSFMPCETSQVSFELDASSLRKAISSFGRIRFSGRVKDSGSLPSALEDYEDESTDHTLSHKSISYVIRPLNIQVPVAKPVQSRDNKEWLLKEALTSSTTSPNDSPTYCCFSASQYHSLTPEESAYAQHSDKSTRHQKQIHNWLHQIKNAVENEPVVFENLDIKETTKQPASSFDIAMEEAIFRKYFDQVVFSPNTNWLMNRNAAKEQTNMMAMDNVPRQTIISAILPGQQEYGQTCQNNSVSSERCLSVAVTTSGGESFVYVNSDSDSTCHNMMGAETTDFYEKFSQYWRKYLAELWSSADSMWLLPCASTDQHPLMFTPASLNATLAHDEDADDDDWMIADDDAQHQPRNFRQPASETTTDNGDATAMEAATEIETPEVFKIDINNTFPTTTDYDTWLYKPPPAPTNRDVDKNGGATTKAAASFHFGEKIDKEFYTATSTGGDIRPPPINERAPSVDAFEAAIGWRSVLERVHGLGDERWLLSAAPRCQ